MKDWRSLTQEERKAERDKIPGEYARKQRMNANLAATLDLLKDDQFAQAKAWKVAWGCYLINTPEEISSHCRSESSLLPIKLSKEKAYEILKSGFETGQYEPRGLFYLEETDGTLVGIDNRDGNAWTEEFQTYNECLEWLKGNEIVADATTVKCERS